VADYLAADSPGGLGDLRRLSPTIPTTTGSSANLHGRVPSIITFGSGGLRRGPVPSSMRSTPQAAAQFWRRQDPAIHPAHHPPQLSRGGVSFVRRHPAERPPVPSHEHNLRKATTSSPTCDRPWPNHVGPSTEPRVHPCEKAWTNPACSVRCCGHADRPSDRARARTSIGR